MARNEPFLLFPQCFLLYQIIVSPSFHIFYFISLFATELEELKLAYKVKGKTYMLSCTTAIEAYN